MRPAVKLMIAKGPSLQDRRLLGLGQRDERMQDWDRNDGWKGTSRGHVPDIYLSTFNCTAAMNGLYSGLCKVNLRPTRHLTPFTLVRCLPFLNDEDRVDSRIGPDIQYCLLSVVQPGLRVARGVGLTFTLIRPLYILYRITARRPEAGACDARKVVSLANSRIRPVPGVLLGRALGMLPGSPIARALIWQSEHILMA